MARVTRMATPTVAVVTKPWRTEDAADYLGLSIQVVREHARDGRIKARKVGKSWMFNPEDVLRYTGATPGKEG